MMISIMFLLMIIIEKEGNQRQIECVNGKQLLIMATAIRSYIASYLNMSMYVASYIIIQARLGSRLNPSLICMTLQLL